MYNVWGINSPIIISITVTTTHHHHHRLHQSRTGHPWGSGGEHLPSPEEWGGGGVQASTEKEWIGEGRIWEENTNVTAHSSDDDV